ncbi:MAG TPA: O-antigen ligase family protein [Terriglobales bacterium]|nr:O-antigen ligase family protein [Terriglobales bacterium]
MSGAHSRSRVENSETPGTPVAVKTAPSRLDLVLFYGVFSLLLFAPLAFGAVEPWSEFLLKSGAATLFVLWTVRQFQKGELTIANNPVFYPMLAFAALIAAQLIFRLTAYRYETISNALLYVAYGLLCFLAVQTLRRTSQVRQLGLIFSIYGAALALFALVQALSGTTKLYWIRAPRQGGWIYGPYVNHNHYAGLMEMLAPIPLALALGRQVRGPAKTFAALAAALMAATIFLSGSRGGMIAFVVELFVIAVMMVRKEKRARTLITVAAFVGLLGGLLLWLGGGELAKRVTSIHSEAESELTGGTRLDIDRDGLRMFADKPILGWGLGTFPEVYPQFRSFYTNFFVNAAHNDYIQLLTDMGALGFAAMLWLLFVVYRNGFEKLRGWPNDTNSTISLAALLGVTGILVHSFVDFNLQIPANAALFYVLCTVAAMEPRFGEFHRRSRTRVQDVMTELSLGNQF